MAMKIIETVIKNETVFIYAEIIQDQIWFHFRGSTFTVSNKTQRDNQVDLFRSSSLTKTSVGLEIKDSNININKKSILAPMPGQIVKILAATGQKVFKNQALLILSAMKMEYTLKAPYRGKITMVLIKEGDRVTADQTLITIQGD